MKNNFGSVAVAAAFLLGSAAYAGPVIIDGTDSNDHGGLASGTITSGTNANGWLYMQKALENLGSQFLAGGGTTKNVVMLGQSLGSGNRASRAAASAFNNGALATSSWTNAGFDGSAAIGTYLSTLSTGNTGILFLGTAGESVGDMDASEIAAVNANAAAIKAFVASGGALFAMAESVTGGWGWLTTLIPSLIVVDDGAGGVASALSLTAAGNTAFPSLTNAQLSTGPWHNNFTGNLGSLSVLATDNALGRSVIIGGGIGTVLAAPEPGSLALVALAGLSLLTLRRRAAK